MIEIFKPKNEIKYNFIFAVVFGLLYVANLFFGNSIYSSILTGLLFLIYGLNGYFYKTSPFLKIEDQKIISLGITGKKEISWQEITSIKYFAAEWTISSKNQKIVVSKDKLTPNDWNAVNSIIEIRSKQLV
jgi:hypothetical protein